MLPEDQKRILGYFIEEAKDHLNTIEQGLLNLQATLADQEMINEVFRAAHSVKGGAAMLGLGSIQRTSHRMEDFFKLLKESPIRTDRDLESLLLQIFDGLQEQLEQLQGSFGLTDDRAEEIMATLEPVFLQTETHLQALVAAAPAVAIPAPPPAPAVAAVAVSDPETSALQLMFRSDIPALLRDLLTTFKQPDDLASRQRLAQLCQRLHSLGEQFELTQWCALTQAVSGAVANPQQTYRALAPVVIRDLKQAQDSILAGTDQVFASPVLLAMVPSGPAFTDENVAFDALLAEAFSDDPGEPELVNFLALDEADSGDLDALTDASDWLDALVPEAEPGEADLEAIFELPEMPTAATSREFATSGQGPFGPDVGAAELNSLADLFEGDRSDLEDIWEEEDFSEPALPSAGLIPTTADAEGELADLLQPQASSPPPPSLSAEAEMASLFGYSLGAEPLPRDGSDPFGEDALNLDFLSDTQPDDGATPSTSLTEADLPDPTAATVPAGSLGDDLNDFFDLPAAETAPVTLASPPSGLPDGADFFDPDSSSHAQDGQDDPFAQTLELNDLWGEAADPEVSPLPVGDGGIEAIAITDLPQTDSEAPQDHGFDALFDASPATAGSDLAFDTDFDAAWNADYGHGAADPFGELGLVGSDAAPLGGRAGEMDMPAQNQAPGEGEGATAPLMPPGLGTDLEPAPTDFPMAVSAPDSADLPTAEDGTEPNLTAGPDNGPDNGPDPFDPPMEQGLSDFNHPSATSAPPDPDARDDFDDLDQLLTDDGGALPSPQTDLAVDQASAAHATIAPVAAASTDGDDDEFGDLEKLLEEAEQLGGAGSGLSSRRTTSGAASRRQPGRTATVADQTMRVSVNHLDNLSNLVGELVVNRNSLEQDQERLRQFLDNLLSQVQQLNDVGQRMRDLYERSLLESSLIANRQAFSLKATDRGGGAHVTGATFDALEMDRFTGFHTLSQEMIELIVRVREASSDIEFTIDSTDQIARQFRQVTTQLQEGLNKARMVPFGQTADRLPRAVRDISLKCGKEARLVVEGRDTLIDKMILERLYDPMTHLVNNAITHGIESPEERLALGKPREGVITVRAFYQGNQTVIYIADNGGGINATVVKAKAIQQGLITPDEAQTMTELEVYDLLFLPGFSTRDQADDFSGRGIGMDVVRTALADIRGSITIESEVGKGTSFTIRLPLTLSITKALSCVNNQARIAFPMDGVEDMFDVPRARLQTDEQGHASILWRDILLPYRSLGELLQFNRSLGRGRVYGGSQDEDMVSIVVLRNASTFLALEVDQVIGEQEIVIKQLEGPVPKPIGIAGATVLGDGRVMPIADVLELIDLASGRMRRDSSASLWAQPEGEEMLEPVVQSDPTVLIVDDSITVRELLSMSFNKVGYRVEQARDGQEAWEKLRSGLPCDLVFCDIEMPRMDGLELLSRMQKDETLSQIPIAMLTSRGADRHRQMAVDLGAKGYFTKPYLEEMLLDAAQRMLKGENMVPRSGVEG
ncbi:MAG: response regulator [Nodosilinea sp.]